MDSSLSGIYIASDLHGRREKYEKLCNLISANPPDAVLIAGDILPSGAALFTKSGKVEEEDFIHEYLAGLLKNLKENLGDRYPQIFVIPGNDDAAADEPELLTLQSKGLLTFLNSRTVEFGKYTVTGYPYVPPTPFALKDWEKYDVSRYVDPGAISPESGRRTVHVEKHKIRYATIQKDLEKLKDGLDPEKSIFLFHSPPYKTGLDRAALDGVKIDHVELDPHVGSIAIKRFIENFQPLLTIHGHVHESTGRTGVWKEKIGRTTAVNAASGHDEFAVIKLDPDDPFSAERILL